jgi:hypothetical protein
MTVMTCDYISALTLSEVKIVLQGLAALHATAHHFINTFPGKLLMMLLGSIQIIRDTFLALLRPSSPH